MKGIFLALVFLATTASTQTLSQEERSRAVAELEGSRKAFLDATHGLSAAQWSFQAAPDRWSATQCSEHIALAEDFILGIVTDRVMKSPVQVDKYDAAQRREKDDLLLKTVPDRTTKFKAPEPLVPTSKFGSPTEIVKHFEASRAHSIDYVKTTQDDLRDHFAEHPAAKELDGYQWILLMSAHTRRHTDQILEVKADPGFPKQ